MKVIHALGLLALLIGATFAKPLSPAELEPETGDLLQLTRAPIPQRRC